MRRLYFKSSVMMTIEDIVTFSANNQDGLGDSYITCHLSPSVKNSCMKFGNIARAEDLDFRMNSSNNVMGNCIYF